MTTLSATIQQHEEEFASLELSDTIHELQAQLQAALDVASGLKEENDTLKKHLQDNRASIAQQQCRNKQWRESWKKETDLASKREQKLAQDEKAWEIKLADKRRQLDELCLQLSEKKDVVKRKFPDEFHTQGNNNQSIKIEYLEKEAEKWKKKHAIEKQNWNQKLQETESKLLREAADATSLRQEIASLQHLYTEHLEVEKSNQTLNHPDKVRELLQKLSEKDLFTEKLSDEAKEMRKARDAAVARCDELSAKHHLEHGKALRECAKHEAKCTALQERILIAERDANETSALANELENDLAKATKDISRLKCALDAKKAEHEESMKQLRQDKKQCDHELRTQLLQAQQLLAEEQDKATKAEQDLKEAHDHHIQCIKKVAAEFEGNRGDAEEQLVAAQAQIQRIENKFSDLQQKKNHQAESHQAEMQRLKHACESCHKDLNLALLQKEEMSKMCEAMSAKALQQTKQLEEVERKLMKTDEQHQLLGNEKEIMRRQLDELSLEKANLHERLQIISDQTLAATKEAEKRANQVVKEQRRSEAYKEKALEAHQRNIEAKRLLESLRNESDH